MQQHKHIQKKEKKKRKEKKRETEGEKEDCFPKLVINIDQHLNEALTLLIHTITCTDPVVLKRHERLIPTEIKNFRALFK